MPCPRRLFRSPFPISVILLLAASLPALLGQGDLPDLLKTADEVAQKVSRLRGLEQKSPVKKGTKTREEVSAYLQQHVRENYEEAELLKEGRMLKSLGLIPVTTDYRSFMLKLLTEQVGGYYDPEAKTLFIAGWLPADLQKPVMAHELTHALQDQHFDLQRLVRESRDLKNDDQQLARQAVFEGDAMAVMLDFLLEPVGRSFTTLPDLVFIMRAQMSSMEAQYEVFRQAPAYLREVMLFPYGYGAAFLQKVRSSQPWTAVDAIYSDLPVSTEQIIHPEKYLGTRDLPQAVDLEDPSPRLGSPWKCSYRNVLGEFTLFALLSGQVSEERARRAAAGWDGDTALLVEGEGDAAFVTGESVWDTPSDAEEFFLALQEALRLRHAPQTPAGREEPAARYEVEIAGLLYSAEREGTRVRYTFGMPAAEARKLRSADPRTNPR
jgi:hypothetical protein